MCVLMIFNDDGRLIITDNKKGCECVLHERAVKAWPKMYVCISWGKLPYLVNARVKIKRATLSSFTDSASRAVLYLKVLMHLKI